MARPQDKGEGACDGAATEGTRPGSGGSGPCADTVPCRPAGATKRRRSPGLPGRRLGLATATRTTTTRRRFRAGPGRRTSLPPLARLTSAPSTAAGAPLSEVPGPRAPSDRASVAAAADSPAETRAAAAQTAAVPSSRVLLPPSQRADPSGTFATLLAFHGCHVTARHARFAPPALPGPSATCGPALSQPARPRGAQ